MCHSLCDGKRIVGGIIRWVCGAVFLAGNAFVWGQNTPPQLEPVPSQTTREDVPIVGLPLRVSDLDSPATGLRVTAASSNPRILPPRGIVLEGEGEQRWLSLYPAANSNGVVTVTVQVTDPGGLEARRAFILQIQAENDPPQIEPIPSQTVLVNSGASTVPVAVSDPETYWQQLKLKAWTLSVGLFALQPTVMRGTTNPYVMFRPSPDAVGSTSVFVEATDGLLTNRVAFVVTVQPAAFAPTTGVGSGVAGPVLGVVDVDGDRALDLFQLAQVQLVPGGSVPLMVCRADGRGGFSSKTQLGVTGRGGAWGDFDGDGDPDLMAIGTLGLTEVRNLSLATRLIRFEARTNLLAQGSFTNAVVADFDRDGRLDVMVDGMNATRESGVFWLRNEGEGDFALRPNGVPAGTLLATADADGDGDYDLLVQTPKSLLNPSALLLLANRGDGTFPASRTALPVGTNTFARAGFLDLNGDGMHDLWLLGQLPGGSARDVPALVLLQAGGRFVPGSTWQIPHSIASTLMGMAWDDFDSDGDVDVVTAQVMGSLSQRPSPAAWVRWNDGAGGLALGDMVVTNLYFSMPLALDVNFDSRPDLLAPLTSPTLVVLRNQLPRVNALPSAPAGLSAWAAGNLLTLAWNEAWDDTQSTPLTYNVRVGTTAGGNEILSAMALPDGTRLVRAEGNTGFNRWLVLRLPALDVDTVWWSVQAVDASLLGGPFAPEQSVPLNLPGNQPPQISEVPEVTTAEDQPAVVEFTVSDDRTPAEAIWVTVEPQDSVLCPPNGLTVVAVPNSQPPGARRRVVLKPGTNRAGTTQIALVATDRNGAKAQRLFAFTVCQVLDQPRPTFAVSVADQALEASFAADPGSVWQLEGSQDLVRWEPVEALAGRVVVGSSGAAQVAVPIDVPHRFFRIRLTE